jgi:hypothetical protein
MLYVTQRHYIETNQPQKGILGYHRSIAAAEFHCRDVFFTGGWGWGLADESCNLCIS